MLNKVIYLCTYKGSTYLQFRFDAIEEKLSYVIITFFGEMNAVVPILVAVLLTRCKIW